MKQDISYIEVKLYPSEAELEAVTTYLSANGIDEISIKSPEVAEEILADPETYKWEHVDKENFLHKNSVVTFYLEASEEAEKKAEQICRRAGCKHEINQISDDGWKDSYKEHFHPIIIGDELEICPVWEEPTLEESRVVWMDPGLAFGTGDHETTKMCLSMLVEEGCAGKDVLDVGTGSGIIALSAAKLGAHSVLGTDIDEEAVRVAKENTRLNNEEICVSIEETNLVEGIDFHADIAVSNIIAEIIVDLAPHIGRHLRRSGIFITSGILSEKSGMVIDALEENGFETLEVREDGEWCAIKARRKIFGI